MADRGGIQLLPETRKRIEVQVPGENRLVYIGVGIILLVGVSFGVLKGITSSLASEIDQKNAQILQMNRDRDTETEQKLIALSQQSSSIIGFLDNHVFLTQALAKVERVLQQQVRVTTFTATVGSRTITFTANAPSYTTIARQVASLVADDGVLDVEIGGARTANSGGFEFTVTLKFDESKYLKK